MIDETHIPNRGHITGNRTLGNTKRRIAVRKGNSNQNTLGGKRYNLDIKTKLAEEAKKRVIKKLDDLDKDTIKLGRGRTATGNVADPINTDPINQQLTGYH